jgi:hypothetical protein
MAIRHFAAGAAAVVITALVAATFVTAGTGTAEAQSRRVVSNNSTGYSYMASPRTRVYVSRRSWLDAGTEVMPGDRKYLDYVLPLGWNLADHNSNRGGFRRQPLPDPWDLPGSIKW